MGHLVAPQSPVRGKDGGLAASSEDIPTRSLAVSHSFPPGRTSVIGLMMSWKSRSRLRTGARVWGVCEECGVRGKPVFEKIPWEVGIPGIVWCGHHWGSEDGVSVEQAPATRGGVGERGPYLRGALLARCLTCEVPYLFFMSVHWSRSMTALMASVRKRMRSPRAWRTSSGHRVQPVESCLRWLVVGGWCLR